MNVKALEILLGNRPVGYIFQYALARDQVINRFVAHEAYAKDPNQEILSLAYRAAEPEAQAAFWAATNSPQLNGAPSKDPQRGWLLPAFFQNLLPEGPLRAAIAEKRKCDINDHFEILAAIGSDLPGNVFARPVELTREELSRLITNDNDALEMSVTADPLEDGFSVSGVQAKLAAVQVGDTFVARTTLTDREQVKHVIAKLPSATDPSLPELEHLSLQLAKAAGCNVVESALFPLQRLKVEHEYDLGNVSDDTLFLAVYRYDRDVPTDTGRMHVEDFAQVLGVQPENKYDLEKDYLEVAKVLMALPESLGEKAVHELLRRILVNEMLGNPDMHLKNMGLLYLPDGGVEFPPAYDIVGYAAYLGKPSGRGLKLMQTMPDNLDHKKSPLNEVLVRAFCSELELTEKPALTALRRCRDQAYEKWPTLIKEADLTMRMRDRLLQHLEKHQAQQRQLKPKRSA